MEKFVSMCREWLLQSSDAMAYLKGRGMTEATISEFKIGYFPKQTKFIYEVNNQPELNKLRGRIVVPIFSEFGKIVGIAGRVPDASVKGWWNTSFSKSSHLYGFNVARKAMYDQNKGYIFEGYFDRIMLAQHGLTNSVGAMSTNVGVRRIGLMARYCDRLCICFDTDQNDSGLLGMFRTLADMYAIGIGRQPSTWELTMIQLPVKVDPDEFVCQFGLNAFLALEKPLSEDLLKNAEKAHAQLKWRMAERKKTKETL